MKNSIGNIIKLIIALGLGIFIIWFSLKDLSSAEKSNIINSFQIANYWWVFLGIIAGIISHIFRAVRWKMLLNPMGFNPSVYHSFLAVMVGYFANMGIPRSGELARCSVLYNRDRIPVDKSFGTVILERAIDMLLFFILFTLALVVEHQRISNYLNERIYPKLSDKLDFISLDLLFGKVGLFLAASFIILVLVFYKKLITIKWIKKILNIFKGIWEGLLTISKIEKPILFVIYSLSIWFFYYLTVLLALAALDSTAHLGLGAALSVLVLGSIGIMVTPGGIGLYPVIVAETLVLYGIAADSGIGLAIGWISWSAQTIMILAVGGVSLILVSIKSKKS